VSIFMLCKKPSGAGFMGIGPDLAPAWSTLIPVNACPQGLYSTHRRNSCSLYGKLKRQTSSNRKCCMNFRRKEFSLVLQCIFGTKWNLLHSLWFSITCNGSPPLGQVQNKLKQKMLHEVTF
jgi:hypothetical protein